MDNPFLIQEDNSDIRDRNLDRSYERYTIEEESLWFRGESSLRSIFNNKKINLLKILVLLLFAGMAGRLSYIQLLQGQSFLAVAEGNRIKKIPIRAPRGIIYDREKNMLVKNFPTFRLEIVPSEIEFDKIDLILDQISQIVPLQQEKIIKELKSVPSYSNIPIVIKENINHDQFLDLKILTNSLSGVEVNPIERRQYLYGESIAHLLGYLGKIGEGEKELVLSGRYLYNDYIGRSGLEKQYEEVLRGVNGYREVEVNALGQQVKFINEVKPRAGQSLILNIDIELQQKLWQELKKQSQKAGSKRAAAVAIDPNNGKILALVSLPSFDNNIFSDPERTSELQEIFTNKDQPLFFRPLQGEYPSGSTFKPLVATAALVEGIITPSTTFLSTGGIRISRWFFPDWKAGGHGLTNVTKAIAESVNTFFYYIGGGYKDFKGLGVKKITAYAKKFGLTEPTGIDFPVEADGFLPDPEWKKKVKGERWYIGDTYNLSIGQGDILVTPLQMAVAYSMILNGGKRFVPELVDGFYSETSQKLEKIKPQIKYQFDFDPQVLSTVKLGLREAVKYGSARYLNLLNVSSGGKTGTAQVGGDKKPHAWFIGFAPYDKPQILLAIIIENGGEGSTYAVPVAFEVFKWYFSER